MASQQGSFGWLVKKCSICAGLWALGIIPWLAMKLARSIRWQDLNEVIKDPVGIYWYLRTGVPREHLVFLTPRS